MNDAPPTSPEYDSNNEDLESFQKPRRLPWAKTRGIDAVVKEWRSNGVGRSFVLDETLPPKAPSHAPIPSSLAPCVQEALRKRGITELYSHQAKAVEMGLAKKDFVVATPTASGKSLCYALPVLHALATDEGARAMFLFPTKALSRDQEENFRVFMKDAGLPSGAITFDGDTPGDARRAAKERAGVLITNPDMLHAGILPHHTSWARLFSNLRYVVIDEVHMYRGVFGSHMANVVRRLRRIAKFHGANPTFIMASATIGNPGPHASRIIGRPCAVIDESGAPTGPKKVLVYNPPVVNAELGIRASYLKSAVRIAVDLVRADVPTLLFGQSRNGVEVMLKYMRDRLRGDLDADAIYAYRGGYLPKQRRAIERRLRNGEIRCVVSTSALELGIDIGSLDAVVCAGYPGTMAALWQRFGRAGRREESALNVLVASSAPLDQFVALTPRQIISAPVEQARIDPDNVEILLQHLKCAAFELPFEGKDLFGDLPVESLTDALQFLSGHGLLHHAPDGNGELVFHWASDAYPASGVSLRSIGWDNFVIIDLDTDKTIAEMDWRSTHTMLHEQAIYQHDAAQYQVERLDFDNHKAFVRRVKPDYYTTAMTHTKVSVLEEDEVVPIRFSSALAPSGAASSESVLAAGSGEVSVVEKVVGYKKIKYHSHENVGYGEVHLPEMQMHTSAFWLTVPEELVSEFLAKNPMPRPSLIDSLRGMLSAMHTVACTALMVDPRDLGRAVGDRSAPDGPIATGGGPGFDPTLFLYDHVAGGIGLAPRLFDERDALLRRTRRLVEGCPCSIGCPACIGPDAGLPQNIPGVQPKPRRDVLLAFFDHVGLPRVH
ncbi:MAG: DEAD/DEAH box helicase domain-containing protein [Polyangiales bacterium]